MKKGLFRVRVDVYDVDVVVSLNMSKKETLNSMKKSGIVKNDLLDEISELSGDWGEIKNARGRTFRVAGGHVVYIKTVGNRIIDIGTIVHECTHISNALFWGKGMDVCNETDEAHAYLVQYLTKAICAEVF